MPVFKLNLGVKDAYAADNLMKKLFSNYSLSSQTGNYYLRLFHENVPVYSQLDDNYLSISNAPNVFELKTSETISLWEEEILSNRMMGYADLKPKRYEALYTDMRYMKDVLPYWNMFDHVVMRGDKMGSAVDIELTDSDDGFLWRMMQQINTTYKEKKNGSGVNS